MPLVKSRDDRNGPSDDHIAAEFASLLFFVSLKGWLIFSDVYPKDRADKNKGHLEGEIYCWEDEEDSPNGQHLPYCEHGHYV